MLEGGERPSEFSGQRKSPEEIVELIFKVLPTESFKNTSHISRQMESSWATIDSYLRLVWRIQRGPRLIANAEGSSNRLLWKKEYGKMPEKVVT